MKLTGQLNNLLKKRVFLNDADEVVSPEKATKCIETEYDDKGNLLKETFYFADKVKSKTK